VCVGCGNFLHCPQIVAKLIMRPRELPPVELLQDRFDYDPETGILTYRNNHSNGKIKAGTPVKVQEGNYAKVVTSDGTKHYAHRIAWALHYNEQLSPNVLVDHINGIKSDNRICNLRLVSYSENGHNRAHQRNNTSGHRGVKWDKKKKDADGLLTSLSLASV